MKKILMLVTIVSVFLISCKKDSTSTATIFDNNNSLPQRVVVTNSGSNAADATKFFFQYDGSKRITQLIRVSVSNSTVTDSVIYSFSYSGIDSIPKSYAEDYYELTGLTTYDLATFFHLIKFDGQHRILKDTITSSSSSQGSPTVRIRNYNYSSTGVVINTNIGGVVGEMDTINYLNSDVSYYKHIENSGSFNYLNSSTYTYSNNYYNLFYKFKALSILFKGYSLFDSKMLPDTENYYTNSSSSYDKSHNTTYSYTIANNEIVKIVGIASTGDVFTWTITY